MPDPNSDPAALEENLRHAAMFGDAATVERLLDDGADVNAADRRGWTPLLRATQQRQFSTARLLIERGADVTLVDKRQRSALLWAAQYGDARTARLILEKGAIGNLPDANGRTPIQQAIRAGRTDIVGLLLKYDTWPHRYKAYYLDEALFLSVKRGKIQTVKRLLEAGADPNREHFGNPFLLKGGMMWQTPLMLAAKNQREDIAHLLLDFGASATAKTEGRHSALTECLSRPLPENADDSVIRLLMQRGATIGLEEAVVADSADLTRKVLAQGRCDVEMPDSHGRTLLTWACLSGSLDIVRLLVEQGANVNYPGKHETPLTNAARSGDLEKVKFLIDKGANPQQVSGRLKTAFYYAAARGHIDTATWLREHFGFNQKEANEALAAAAARKNAKAVLFLLDCGVSPDATGETSTNNRTRGRTALMYAAWYGRTDIAQLLIVRGASVNQRDAKGDTALWFATSSGRKTALRLLLNKGADKDSIEKSLAWAEQLGNESVTSLLRKALDNLNSCETDLIKAVKSRL